MSIFPEYESYDAVGLAELVRSGEVEAAELLEAAIERCEQRNPSVNAVVHAFYDRARETVAESRSNGPFHGVPFLLKDVGAHYGGEPTGYACRLFDGFVAERDTTLVGRYRQAGLVIFGKTNTPELALAVTTEPDVSGPTLNPWNPEFSPGGSSGGAAAAVATGIVPAAHGSDGGGSIRIPASHCGVVGLKPTRGRVPTGPDRAEGWAGMAQNHVITRSVRDAAAFLDAVEGPEPGDPYHPPAHRGSWAETLARPVAKLRVALIRDAFNGEDVDPDIMEIVVNAAGLCEQLGHHVEEARCPLSPEELHNCATLILSSHVNADIQARCRVLGRELRREDVTHVTWRMAQAGAEASASDYAAALGHIHYIGRRMGEFSDQYDVILSPTTAAPAPRLGEINMDTEDLKGYMQVTNRYTAFTQLLNVTGQPAISLPLGRTSGGLPAGVQLAAPQGGEGLLFGLAAQLERVRPWTGLCPRYEGSS